MNRAISMLGLGMIDASIQSLMGFAIWVGAVACIQPGWAPGLLLFGPLVLYPLLLSIDSDDATIRVLAMAAFLPAVASHGLDQGVGAALLTLPWLTFAIAMLIHRLRARQDALAIIHAYLVVGAGWLVLARLGERPLGFEHVIVHATAVHFHYAGSALPLMALRLIRQDPSRRLHVLFACLLLGMPAVAAGITLTQLGVGWIECAAVWLFSAACVWFACEQIRVALALRQPLARGLLCGSSLSLLAAVTLALLYATGNAFELAWLDIPFMIRWHGPIQAFGFALPATVAWSSSPLAA